MRSSSHTSTEMRQYLAVAEVRQQCSTATQLSYLGQ
jgi:hypothetical protein